MPASPYERAYPDAIYVRGLAYLGMHNGAAAVAEFQKIVDHKGANWAATWVHPNWGQSYSLSYLGMGRGYALAGENTPATHDFLEDIVLNGIEAALLAQWVDERNVGGMGPDLAQRFNFGKFRRSRENRLYCIRSS